MDLPGARDAYFSEHVKTEQEYESLPDPGIQGLFLSHAHHDHDGNVPFLNKAARCNLHFLSVKSNRWIIWIGATTRCCGSPII
jgi:mRNA degradation ribonuclease J1/J2